jgi:hypothetical protein
MLNWLRTAVFMSLLGALAFGAGCAQERDPINKVQPNALNKHFFAGADLSDRSDDPQFFWRGYDVDASASNSFIGVGSWRGIDRVVFEIQETQLVVRKAYAIVDGQDKRASNADPNVPSGTDAYGRTLVKAEDGAIVARYKISSQFDIRRSYNPQTGEELNIVEENSSDRPWNQREYFRVDWSSNDVVSPMWEDMFFAKYLAMTPVTGNNSAFQDINDPRNEDAPRIDEAAGYFETTDHWVVNFADFVSSPFSDITGQVPACFAIGIYTGTASAECDPQEATVRNSYWRIDAAQHDVEPLENTYADQDVIANPGGLGGSLSVGIVTPGRQGFDPQYGYTDKLFHRFAHRHNTWQKAHVDTACNDNSDMDANGTADQCEGVKTGHSGSQCDLFFKKCTIPIRDRQIKTVGYWVNSDAPPELQDDIDTNGKLVNRGTLEDLIDSWNQLMRVGLASAREVECRRTGDGDRDTCHGLYFETGMTSAGLRDPATMDAVHFGDWLVERPKVLDKDPTYPQGMYPDLPHLKGLQALTFCHNPVRDYDRHDVCGKTGDNARVGDIRKNFIFYWPYDSRAHWGGIANWEADPLTGEIIGGAAQIMGRSATYAAAYNRDVLQVAMGDVKIEDLIQGIQADRYAKELMNGHGPFDQGLSAAEQQQRLDNVAWTSLANTFQNTQVGTAQQRQIQTLIQMRNSVSDPTQMPTAQLEWEALMNKARGSKYEAQLVDSGWLVNALGADPNTPITESILERASPLRGLDSGRLTSLRAVFDAAFEQMGVCFDEGNAPSYGSVAVPSLATYFKNKYPGDITARGQAIYDEIWKETVKGIALHEIGHSLGMLHQFASSWDAVNYNPQYWQLRTNEGQTSVKCNGPRDPMKPDTCMGPRYNDPETLDEQGLADESRPDIVYFGNTSTMEYQYERFLENVGLGTFDLHTMKALYGGVIESIDPRVMPNPKDQRAAGWRSFSQLIEKDLYDGNFRHYTEEARLLNVFDPKRDCRDATDEEKTTGKWRIVHGKVCAPAPRDIWAWRDFKSSDVMYFQGGACKGSNPQCNDGNGGDLNGPYWRAANVPGAPGADQGKEFVRWAYKWGTFHNAYYHTNDTDAGADAYEVTVNTIRRFDATYPWAYFRRQNKEYYYRPIAASTTDRYFDRLHSYNWLMATNIGRANTQSAADDNQYKPDIMAQGEMAKALTRWMTLPEPGGFNVSPAFTPPESTRQIYDTGTGSTSLFNVGIVTGRYINEQYNNVLGGSWDYLHWVDHAGFSIEKQRLIESIVDSRPTLFTISRQNALDGRNVYINVRTNLPNYVDRLVGAVLSEDWESLGQYVPSTDTSKTPGLATFDLTTADPTRSDPSAKILFPNIGYKTQIATQLYTAANASLSGDQTLQHKMNVWVDGTGLTINIPDNQKIKACDPATGYTYVARKYGREDIDGKSVELGIASRMLEHANALIADAYLVQRDGNNKPILDSFGRPTLILDGNGQPQSGGNTTVAAVGRYIQVIDAAALFSRWFTLADIK